MAKRGLIITADDMGYNVERNQGIIECFEKGGITNSSLMVNGVASEDAAKLALKHGLPTGLHFNISEGVPVRADSKYKTLTKDNGHFFNIHNLRKAVAEGRIDPKEVKEELTNQIVRYTELIGDKPAYVDGHQHMHMLPGLVETFARTLAEHGIRATRLPHELDIESATSDTFFHTVSRDAQLAKPVLRANSVRASDAFYGLVTMGSNMTTPRLQTGIKRAFDWLTKSADKSQPVTCELMTHPGYACKGTGGCGDGPDDFSQSPDREHEKAILESEEMRNFYTAADISLTSYHKWLAP